MNILTDQLPDNVLIFGAEYPVYTDFRNWIKFDIAMFDSVLPLADKFVAALSLCYSERLPPNSELALKGAIDFYTGINKEVVSRAPLKGDKNDDSNENKVKRIYSFQHDDHYIYAAFLAQYGIDLQKTDMHWWIFSALFAALDESHKISKIMEYRSIDLAKIKDKEQKAFYRRMKSMFRLPDMRSEEQKEADMIAQMASFF